MLDKLCRGVISRVKCLCAIQARKAGSIKPIERTDRPLLVWVAPSARV
jgi:hypothetical protein